MLSWYNIVSAATFQKYEHAYYIAWKNLLSIFRLIIYICHVKMVNVEKKIIFGTKFGTMWNVFGMYVC